MPVMSCADGVDTRKKKTEGWYHVTVYTETCSPLLSIMIIKAHTANCSPEHLSFKHKYRMKCVCSLSKEDAASLYVSG